MTKFGTVTEVVQHRVSNGTATPRPKLLGPFIYSQTVWFRATKFDKILRAWE